MTKNAFSNKQKLLRNCLNADLKKMIIKVFVTILWIGNTVFDRRRCKRLEAMEMWIWRKIIKQ